MARPKTVPTIRFNVPGESLEDFKAYMQNLSERFASSLAPPLSSFDDWVATISFKTMPEAFRNCTKSVDGAETSVSISLPTRRILDLSIDIHFHGLTPLNHTEAPTVE